MSIADPSHKHFHVFNKRIIWIELIPIRQHDSAGVDDSQVIVNYDISKTCLASLLTRPGGNGCISNSITFPGFSSLYKAPHFKGDTTSFLMRLFNPVSFEDQSADVLSSKKKKKKKRQSERENFAG